MQLNVPPSQSDKLCRGQGSNRKTTCVIEAVADRIDYNFPLIHIGEDYKGRACQ